jgi:hypothetical protein
MSEAELSARLERLERDNRRFKRLGIAALVLAAALGAIYATRPVPNEIDSHQFVLLDGQGRARLTISTPKYAGAAVGMNADDPGIWMTDRKGTDRTMLTSDGLRFADATGRPLASYSATRPVPLSIRARDFEVVDAAGVPRAELSTIMGDSPSLVFFDGGGKERVLIEESAKGPSIALSDTYGRRRFIATVFKSSPHLWLTDDEQKLRLALEVNEKKPGITLSDDEGYSLNLGSSGMVNEVTGATQQTSAASIIMFGNGKEHHVIWRAP